MTVSPITPKPSLIGNLKIVTRKKRALSAMLGVSLLASAVFSVTLPVSANPPDGVSPSVPHKQAFATAEEREARRRQIQQKLGITQDQAQKLKAVREQNHGRADQLHQQMRQKRQALMQYVSDPKSDPAKARAMQQEIDQVQRQLSNLRMDAWFEMRKILTPEQLEQMQSIRGKRQEKF